MGRHHVQLIERFYSRVLIGDECWGWTGAVGNTGYARLWFEGKWLYGHRSMYEMLVGPIPKKMDIDHECHNRAAHAGLCEGGHTCLHRQCTRPDHMVIKPRRANLLASPLTEASRLIGTHKAAR